MSEKKNSIGFVKEAICDLQSFAIWWVEMQDKHGFENYPREGTEDEWWDRFSSYSAKWLPKQSDKIQHVMRSSSEGEL